MAKILPSGSGATRALPPNLLDPAALSRWTVTYEVDWTTVLAGTTNLKTAGLTTVNGVKWNPEETGNATSMDIINGTGLRIVPSGGSFWTGTKDAPRIHCFVADGSGAGHGELVSGAKPYDVIAFQFLLTVNTDVASSGQAVGLATGNNTAADYLTVGRAHDGALRTTLRGEGSSTSSSYYVTTASPKTFYELVAFPGGGMSAYATTDTDFADPLTRTSDFKSAGIQGTDLVFPTANFDIFGDGTNWRLWLYGSEGGSYTFTKFRVLKAKWSE